jgi:hypothetical protein
MPLSTGGPTCPSHRVSNRRRLTETPTVQEPVVPHLLSLTPVVEAWIEAKASSVRDQWRRPPNVHTLDTPELRIVRERKGSIGPAKERSGDAIIGRAQQYRDASRQR